MSFLAKIYSLTENILRQPTRRQNIVHDKFLPYFDGNNNFPLVWHQAISESPSATSCISTIQSFMVGSGFTDMDLEKKIINTQGENFFQLHQKICKDFAEFEGFAVKVLYNAMGKISELYHMPFENVRLGKPDDRGYIAKILYSPYFGTADEQINKDITAYDTFNPKQEAVIAQINRDKEKYRGQIMFVGTTTSLSRFYPMPEAYSAIKWMKIETGVSDYHESNINNAFLQPFMLIMKGNPGEFINPEDPEDKRQTKGEAFDAVVSSDFMGAKRVGNMFVYWANNPDEKPDVLPMPTNNSGDLFLSVDTQATKKITIAFKVPAILANINEGVSLGGDGNTIRVAVKLMQTRLVDKQRMLTDAYENIFKNFEQAYNEEINIKPYHPYPELEVLDDKIWNSMTDEERRDWIRKNTNIDLIDDTIVETPPAAGISNAIPVKFPDSVIKTVKRTLDYKEKMQIRCGSKGGLMLSELILNNRNIGFKDLKRIYNYLKRNEKYQDSPPSDGCGAIEYNMWGGKEMRAFLESKLEEVDTWLNKTS